MTFLQVQSLFRGLLCRRRWHNIVQDYIRSPHAQSMRKRNQIVFELVRSEEEYLQTLSTLVTSFFRPLKMAASSKKPPLSHEEVNSIFLNRYAIVSQLLPWLQSNSFQRGACIPPYPSVQSLSMKFHICISILV